MGWGGLADAFDENKPNWSDEFAELYATLSPEEYAAARASTLNAHYTSPTVIKAIYEAVGNMGFQSGNILEPSMGVGNFFGLLPEQMQGSKLYGVELDSITGRIAKQLYPKADITIAGFETTDRKDFYDLAVGNVPFGQYQVDDRAYNKDLDASEIEVRLGATWIDKEYIRQFMFELLEPAFYVRRSIDVNYSDFSAEWNITGKSVVGRSDINANMTYGTERANAYKILEDTLNLRDVRIYDTITDADGKEKRVLNSKETTLAQQKQQAIKDAFQEWIWKDPTRRHELVQKYNELFNATRPREYNGQHITFSGMNPEIQLREHQLNAVAHILYGGNTLLAHEVGAGKTFEMVAAAMESKRLGLCHKPMFVVPNHLIPKFGRRNCSQRCVPVRCVCLWAAPSRWVPG